MEHEAYSQVVLVTGPSYDIADTSELSVRADPGGIVISKLFGEIFGASENFEAGIFARLIFRGSVYTPVLGVKAPLCREYLLIALLLGELCGLSEIGVGGNERLRSGGFDELSRNFFAVLIVISSGLGRGGREDVMRLDAGVDNCI